MDLRNKLLSLLSKIHTFSLKKMQNCIETHQGTLISVVKIISPKSYIYASWIRSALIQIMACLRPAPSHYLNQCWNVVNSTLENKLQQNFNQNSYIFIQENAFENVSCKMAAILSWPQCVKLGKLAPTLGNVTTYCFATFHCIATSFLTFN